MTDTALLRARVKSVHDYIDELRVWFRERQPERILHALNANSRAMRRAGNRPGDLHIVEPAWWDHRYKQVVALYQPRPEAIKILAEIDGAHLTDIEIAHDQIMARPEHVDAWLEKGREHVLQRRHKNHRIRIWANGNWRSADLHRVTQRDGKEIRERKHGIVFQAYGDAPCRITDEPNCAHLEAKVYGSSAIRRIGIYGPKDLLNFDYELFWRRHFHLYKLDVERLGRWYVNKTKNRRQRSWPKPKGGFHYNEHRSTGGLLCRAVGRDGYGNFSIQRIVNEFGRGPFLKKVPLSASGMVVFRIAQTYPLVATTTSIVWENLQ